MKIQFGKTSRCKSQLQLAALGCAVYFLETELSWRSDIIWY